MEGSVEEEELTAFLMINSAVGHEAAQKLKERLLAAKETAKERIRREETSKERINDLVSIETKAVILLWLNTTQCFQCSDLFLDKELKIHIITEIQHMQQGNSPYLKLHLCGWVKSVLSQVDARFFLKSPLLHHLYHQAFKDACW